MTDDEIDRNREPAAWMADDGHGGRYLYATRTDAEWRARKENGRVVPLFAAPTPPVEPPEDVAGLVERLRQRVTFYLGGKAGYGTEQDALCVEASFAIARLAVERDALREALERTNITLNVAKRSLGEHDEARGMVEERIDLNRAALARA